jgi:hypothetical protein
MVVKSLALLPTASGVAQGAPISVTTSLTATQLASIEDQITAAAATEALARDAEINTNLASQLTTIEGMISSQIASAVAGLPGSPLIRSFLTGLGTAWVSTSSFSVAPGLTSDPANTGLMALASSLTKTTALWVAGTNKGGLDTGTIAANTWYHIFAIANSNFTSIDVLFSLSPSAPALPAGYTFNRRIGSLRTNGSSSFTKYWQTDDLFFWDQVVNELNFVAISGLVTVTLTVPTGVSDALGAIIAIFALDQDNDENNGDDGHILVQALDQTVTSPAESNATTFSDEDSESNTTDLMFPVSSSAQIRINTDISNQQLSLWTRGWLDRRGRDL